jgi:hypothetical protein
VPQLRPQQKKRKATQSALETTSKKANKVARVTSRKIASTKGIAKATTLSAGVEISTPSTLSSNKAGNYQDMSDLRSHIGPSQFIDPSDFTDLLQTTYPHPLPGKSASANVYSLEHPYMNTQSGIHASSLWNSYPNTILAMSTVLECKGAMDLNPSRKLSAGFPEYWAPIWSNTTTAGFDMTNYNFSENYNTPSMSSTPRGWQPSAVEAAERSGKVDEAQLDISNDPELYEQKYLWSLGDQNTAIQFPVYTSDITDDVGASSSYVSTSQPIHLEYRRIDWCVDTKGP